MWLKKTSVTALKRRARLKLDLPSDGDLVHCDNVLCADGRLSGAYGFDEHKYFNAFKAVKVLGESEGWVYVSTDEGLFVCHSKMPTHVSYDPYDETSGCWYQGLLIFSAPGYGTYVVRDAKKQIIYDVGCVSMAVCNDRIFGVDPKGNVHVAPVGEMDFAEAFRITPHTKVAAVVAIGKKLYALGDTCYAVDPCHADDVDVTFRAISHGVGSVVTDSVATLGNRTIFATDSGLRVLQSDRVSPIFTSLGSLVSFDGCVACVHDGKYFITCKRLDGTRERNDITLILDVDKEKVVGVLNQGFENIHSLGHTLYAVQNGLLLSMNQTTQTASWQRTVDFGDAGVKYLDTLLIATKQDASVTVRTDNEKRIYRVKGKRTVQRISLAGHGRTFTVTVQSCGGMDVHYVELTARSYEV